VASNDLTPRQSSTYYAADERLSDMRKRARRRRMRRVPLGGARPSGCSTCGGPIDEHGRCPACERDRLLELELDAFTRPAIRRAQILILVLGILCLANGVWNAVSAAHARAKVADLRAQLEQATRVEQRRLSALASPERAMAKAVDDIVDDLYRYAPDLDPRAVLDRAEARANTASTISIAMILLGLVALAVAAWSRRKTMAACHAIVCVFAGYTLIALAGSGALVLVSPTWLVSTVVVVLAWLAGRKAERLRGMRA